MQEKPFLAIPSQDQGHKVFKLVSNALCYLDGRAQTINESAKNRKNVTAIPKRKLCLFCVFIRIAL